MRAPQVLRVRLAVLMAVARLDLFREVPWLLFLMRKHRQRHQTDLLSCKGAVASIVAAAATTTAVAAAAYREVSSTALADQHCLS
jgi:hypothetical protein